jgi:hypothetical protein
MRYPFQPAANPGLDLSGSGRGNNELSGYFTVYEIAYDSTGNLVRFAADLSSIPKTWGE